MQRLLPLILFIILIFNDLSAQSVLPRTSPSQTIKQNFGLGYLEISYGRPSVRGRKIFGGLQPFGKLWRVGANDATIFTTSKPIEFAGKPLDSGSYAFYAIPEEKSWIIILNKGVKNWGTSGYKESEDVLRVNIPAKNKQPFTETLSFQFVNVGLEICDLELCWSDVKIIIPIKINIKGDLERKIQSNLSSEKPNYWQAANFYSLWMEDHQKAIAMVDKFLEDDKNKNYPWVYLLKAKSQLKLGLKNEAKITGELTKKIAQETGNNDYVELSNEFLKSIK